MSATRTRALLWGWLFLFLGVLIGAAPARHLAAGYGGGLVELREWIVVSNAIFLAWHAGVLAALVYGAGPDPSDAPRGRWLRTGARASFAVALALVIAFAIAPFALGMGPFARGSWPLHLFTALVHLPNALRSLGWALLVLAMADAAPSPRARLAGGALAALVGIDLALVVVHWAQTPVEVVAELHPYVTDLPWLTPWVAASVAFLVILGARARAPQPAPATEP